MPRWREIGRGDNSKMLMPRGFWGDRQIRKPGLGDHEFVCQIGAVMSTSAGGTRQSTGLLPRHPCRQDCVGRQSGGAPPESATAMARCLE